MPRDRASGTIQSPSCTSWGVKNPPLEVQPRDEREEAHLIECHVGDLSEQSTGGVQIRVLPLLTIEQVLAVDPDLQGAAAAEVEAALDRQVGGRERHAADAVDTKRERPLLEGGRRPRRVLLEARVRVEPS